PRNAIVCRVLIFLRSRSISSSVSVTSSRATPARWRGPDTPEHIRTDLRLLQEFPPTLLAELDHTLCWSTFERTLEFTQELMRREEHLQRCGMLADATCFGFRIKIMYLKLYPLSHCSISCYWH